MALRLGLYHELDDLIAKASVGLADLGEKTSDVSQYTLRVGPFTRDRWVGWDFPLAGLSVAALASGAEAAASMSANRASTARCWAETVDCAPLHPTRSRARKSKTRIEREAGERPERLHAFQGSSDG